MSDSRMLPLEIDDWSDTFGRGPIAKLKESLPFIVNARAKLVHRPRSVNVHKISSDYVRHLAIHYWCGGGSTGLKKFDFVAVPGENETLCARCEEKAVEAGRPSSDDLVGRHVHVGGVKVRRTCCLAEGN